MFIEEHPYIVFAVACVAIILLIASLLWSPRSGKKTSTTSDDDMENLIEEIHERQA